MKILILFFCIFIGACLNPESSYQESQSSATVPTGKHLSIHILDVGQGNTTLLIAPNGQAGLIDAGPPLAGLTKLLPELRSLGIESLSWVIISHYDADHLGGLVEVLRGEDQAWDTEDDIPVFGSVWDRGAQKFEETPWFDEYQTELSNRDIIAPGQHFSLGDGAEMRAVLVAGHYEDGSVHHLNADEENEASIALLIEYGNFRYLSAGDLTGGGLSGDRETKDLETYLAELVGPIDVLHLNHHGSRTSTNENYLDKLKPDAAIISSGNDNPFGHPHEIVVERLIAREIETYKTSNGSVIINSDGDKYQIE